MSNKLIEKLSLLTLERNYLKREIDNCWYDRKKRKKLFEKLENVSKQINNVKFKLELERKIKNDNSNRSW